MSPTIVIFKGNETKISTHIVKAISKLTEARSILENSDMQTQEVVAAKEKISECIRLVQERQMMIKLTDSSDLGWKSSKSIKAMP